MLGIERSDSVSSPPPHQQGGQGGRGAPEGKKLAVSSRSVMMLFITITARAKARRGDGEYVRLDEEAG